MSERPTYLLTLRPEPGAVPDVVRLRRLLKALLRGFGLRCLDVRELADDAGPTAAPAGRKPQRHATAARPWIDGGPVPDQAGGDSDA